MTIYAGLDEMRDWIVRADWSGLVSEFDRRCRQIDANGSARIAGVPTDEFESELAKGLARAIAALSVSTKAVYWEFDPDNAWTSAFFLCRDYREESDAHDEWAADFDESRVIVGPSHMGLAREYDSGWDRTDAMVARNLALIARTIAAFGRASETSRSKLPICAGYHDQELVFRVRGPAPVG